MYKLCRLKAIHYCIQELTLKTDELQTWALSLLLGDILIHQLNALFYTPDISTRGRKLLNGCCPWFMPPTDNKNRTLQPLGYQSGVYLILDIINNSQCIQIYNECTRLFINAEIAKYYGRHSIWDLEDLCLIHGIDADPWYGSVEVI